MTIATTSTPDAADDEHLRAVLGRFCTGVTVITALRQGEPVGFTCQSFSALSLEPPYVCFCPSRTSTTWPRIRRAGSLCVNILAADQEEMGRRFAVSGADKFTGSGWGSSPNGSPLLDGALAWIDGSVEREVDGGDHTIVIARITGSEIRRDASPLLFYGSSFGRMAVPAG
ncbi:flavin reductase family protein [Haloechinothrix sp. YIM 98757]|uniref:Flavin reductase family protein n=1 Tax=Haloechinothrix aidingensis TaxID=2752311 RepID=A0A838ABJ5_9PSEU|nr:flavin reductase family protein [Haloechinothrix aidingensis]MBA0126568.1 flavin reductase family protein [Haloechinothrix aidingensis]